VDKVNVKSLYLDGIPINIFEVDNNQKKPVIFSFHGFGCQKSEGLLNSETTLARHGFIVVAIDSILHGERKSSVYDTFSYAEKMKSINDIIIQTANDAVHLYEKYIKFFPNVDKDNVYSIGVSMGGAVGIYLATIYPIKKTASIVGSPSMVEFYAYKQKINNWSKDFYFDRNIEYLKLHDPVLHQHKLSGKIFLTGGIKDNVVPIRYVQMLESNKQVQTKIYPTDHMPNQEHFDDAYKFLLEEV